MKKRTTLRQRLLSWHYAKSRTISIVDLLESDYQGFRRKVGNRVGNSNINFRDAIKDASEDELIGLDILRTEKRLGI